jgi:hypothetical protein
MHAHRSRLFEHFFAEFSPQTAYPWLRPIGDDTAILGLDPTRPWISARGRMPRKQLERAREILEQAGPIPRLVVACHYPVAVPVQHRRDYATKPLVNASELAGWLRSLGPHLFCCGHVHAVWATRPSEIPNQLCLNPGAPFLRDRTGREPPGFLEVVLNGPDVSVTHHGWVEGKWEVRELDHWTGFFGSGTER